MVAVPQKRAESKAGRRAPRDRVIDMVVLDWSLPHVFKNASHYHCLATAAIIVPFQKTHFLCEKSQFGPAPWISPCRPGDRRLQPLWAVIGGALLIANNNYY
jgi:hypothetical protein